MAQIADSVLGDLTAGAVSGNRLDLLAADPVLSYATVTTNTLGNDTATMTGAVTASSGTGVQAYFPAITAGTVTNDGTAGYWAITNGGSGGSSDAVLASGALTTTQAVTSGNTFSLDRVSLFIRDAT